MKKIIIAAVILALILGAGFFLLAPAPVSAAIVYVERGMVEVNTDSAWQSATDEMELEQGDGVRTGDGEATVVLLEGEIIHLEPNSEISLDKISTRSIKISQLAGETWNKVTRISGVSDYTVETPNTVATVRGTEFTLNDEAVTVDEGEVAYADKNDPARKVNVGANMKALHRAMKTQAIGERDKARFMVFKEKYIKQLKRVRERELHKHEKTLALAKDQGYSEQDIKARLHDMDEGREDPDKTYEDIPRALRAKAKRTYLLTKTIRKTRQIHEPLTPEQEHMLRAKIREELAERDMTMEEARELPPAEREALKEEIREDMRDEPVMDARAEEPVDMKADEPLPERTDAVDEPVKERTDAELYPNDEPIIEKDVVVRDLTNEK